MNQSIRKLGKTKQPKSSSAIKSHRATPHLGHVHRNTGHVAGIVGHVHRNTHALCLKGRRQSRSEKSAEVVVAGAGADEARRPERRTERESVTEDMQSCKVMRQMPGQPGRAGRRHGEAGLETASDETGGTLHEHPDTGSAKSMAGTGGRSTRRFPSIARDRVQKNLMPKTVQWRHKIILRYKIDSSRRLIAGLSHLNKKTGLQPVFQK